MKKRKKYNIQSPYGTSFFIAQPIGTLAYWHIGKLFIGTLNNYYI